MVNSKPACFVENSGSMQQLCVHLTKSASSPVGNFYLYGNVSLKRISMCVKCRRFARTAHV